MFTGIIEGLGTIAGVRPSGQGKRLTIQSDFSLQGTRVGDSIAVNGACLTAVHLADRRFEADVSPESVARTTLAEAHTGERVNLERALRLSDRIDGHLVAGHVDGTGVIASRQPAGNAVVVTVAVPEELARQMIIKGSVPVGEVELDQARRHQHATHQDEKDDDVLAEEPAARGRVLHLLKASARSKIFRGTVRPRSSAVLRFTARSIFSAPSTGRS